MSSQSVRGPKGSFTHEVKWLASLSNGITWEGYIGVGSVESTEWHKLQATLAENGNWFVTQLRLQYKGLTLHAVPHADAYSCYAAFAFDPARPQASYQEQAVMGSKVGDTWYVVRLSQDGQVWQEIRQGEDASAVRGS